MSELNELYVSEVTQSNKETGYVNVVVDVIENRTGQDFIVGNFSLIIENKRLDVTRNAQRLGEAIINCFKFYKESQSSDTDKLEIAFNPEKRIGELLPNNIKKGYIWI